MFVLVFYAHLQLLRVYKWETPAILEDVLKSIYRSSSAHLRPCALLRNHCQAWWDNNKHDFDSSAKVKQLTWSRSGGQARMVAVSFAHVQYQADVDFMAPTSLTGSQTEKSSPHPPSGTEICSENKKTVADVQQWALKAGLISLLMPGPTESLKG